MSRRGSQNLKSTKPHQFVIPPRLLPQIRAAAAVMGFSEQEIVQGGIVLYCTYILNRLQPGVEDVEARGKGKAKWTSEEVVSVLASRCVSTRKRRGELSGRRGGMGRKSAITSVGSVLQTLAGGKPKGGSAGSSTGA